MRKTTPGASLISLPLAWIMSPTCAPRPALRIARSPERPPLTLPSSFFALSFLSSDHHDWVSVKILRVYRWPNQADRKRGAEKSFFLKSLLFSVPLFLSAWSPAQFDIFELEGRPDPIICSESVKKILAQIEQISDRDAPVLITGETGTGKELIARAVHVTGVRRRQSLVTFNCAAIAKELAESLLFGHRRGSFTGADRDHPGAILSHMHLIDGRGFSR
jgi:hypothetical protein